MFVLLTLLILVATSLIIGVAHAVNPLRNYAWVIATIGALAAWVLTLLWQLDLPVTIPLAVWQPEGLFAYSPTLRVDGVAWAYGVSLATLCMGVVLTMPTRMAPVRPLAAAGNLILTAAGLLAVLAENPLTLLLVWSAIDLLELGLVLRAVSRPEQSEAAVVGFAARLAGSGLVLWGSASSAVDGAPLGFQSINASTALILLVGVGLRLGVLSFNLPLDAESALRRGLGTVLRMVSAVSSLALLARLPVSQYDPNLDRVLLLVASAVAVFGAWRWARGSSLLGSRPYWVIGLGALALAAALRGNPLGSVTWGSAMALAGGMVFIFSHETRWLKWLVAAGVFSLSGLPFSLTALGWVSESGAEWWPLLALIPAHVLLVTGFLRFVLAPHEPLANAQPQGAQSVYPVAFILMTLTLFLLGLWGWEGALQIGAWIPGLVSTALAAGLVFTLLRLQILIPTRLPIEAPVTAAVRGIGATLAITFWGTYRLLRQGSFVLSRALEGDGGMLWAFVLLVLVINLLGGGQ